MGPGVHTPYQSLAQACRAPGITSEACPEQPGFICKCTGKAWNNPRTRMVGQRPGGVGVRTNWKFPLVHFLTDFLPVEHTPNPSLTWQLVGSHLRDGKGPEARKTRQDWLAPRNRGPASTAYIHMSWTPGTEAMPVTHLDWVQWPAFVHLTFCTDKQPAR